jgi:glycine/D-amino acid oxidase-like deaminating enzyme
MGASTAYHLVQADPAIEVVVIEQDPTYARASTVLSDGNVRIQFNLEENIRMSQYTMEVLETFTDDMAVGAYRPELQPKHQGNLFLTDAPGRPAAIEGMERQQSLGASVEWLDEPEIAGRFPAFRSSTMVGGTLGPEDGSVDPSAMLRGYRAKAAALGASFVHAQVVGLEVDGGQISGVQLADGSRLLSPIVVNCAGAWAADLAATAGVDLPVQPVMRTVYVVSGTVASDGLPSVFLPSGIYAIPEHGQTWLMAWSLPDDPVGYEFVPSVRSRFTDTIWPALVEHLPEFDALHIESAWAGLYAVNTLDGNAILGEWPELPGLWLANGHSGHGFQHAPAIGRYLSELIRGAPLTLDLGRLGPRRIIERRPLHEHAGRII